MLDKRLSLCAELVSGDYICDIGTDHGYLPAELIISGRCSRAIAADINEKPLKFAAATFKKYNISDKVKLILSDGLKNINTSEITDIAIAGMGGELISHILHEGTDKLSPDINLILQPMTKAPALRKYLCKSGFKITCERAVCDKHFCYSVISARKNGKITPCPETAAEIGFMDFSLENERNYALRRINSIISTAKEISLSDSAKGEYYLNFAEQLREYISMQGKSKGEF